ncbi:MAG TPA: carbohydrate kinase family protein [Terriglobales bacterium]|nr:carbohydrate kinase family protein [Terriglobales bacterium]
MPRFDVTIAGELNLDLILYGLPAELPPERELLAERMALTLGSSSAIVAHNLAALGCRVGFASRIGDDPLGQIAVERLAAGGVDVSGIRRVPGATKTGLTVILQRQSLRNILTYPGTIFDLSLQDLDFEYLTSARHFHLSSYYLQRGLTRDVAELFRRLKAAGLTISLDTNDDPDDRWEGGLMEALGHVDVFLPNQRELLRIAGSEDFENAVRQVAEKVSVLVVKMGSKGAMAVRSTERICVPAIEVKFVDPVGAGDSFDAGFLSQFVRGADLETCVRWGNMAGAFSTTQAGGTEAFRDRERLQEFLREQAR